MLRLTTCSKKLTSRLFNSSNYVQTVRKLDTTNTTTLKNGVRVVTQPNDELNSSIGVFFDVGSVNETPKLNGINNFLANTAFRGTFKRSGEEIRKEIEGMGGVMDSLISREMSGYVINCSTKDSRKALEILSDIVLNAKFEPCDVEDARSDLLVNLKNIEYNKVVMDYLHLSAFQGTPLGQSIYGPTDNIINLDRHSLLDYYKNNYKATRMVVVTCGGNFDSDQLVLETERLFGTMDSTYGHSVPNIKEYYRYTGSDIKFRDDDMDYAHVALAVQGPAYSSNERLVLDVANSLTGPWNLGESLGGSNVASPLIRKIVENGLGKYIKPFNESYKTTGLWGVYFVSPRMKVYDLVTSIQQEWMRQATNVGNFEIERARSALRNRLLRKRISIEDLARDVFYYGRVVPVHEIEGKIESISSTVVRDTVHKYVYDKCPVLSAVGPTETIANYNNIRSQMYWFRM